jgi:hypothetical protein
MTSANGNIDSGKGIEILGKNMDCYFWIFSTSKLCFSR